MQNYYFCLDSCPDCQKTDRWVAEICAVMPELKPAAESFLRVEESRQKELADAFDYEYVPAFFADGFKLHEGIPSKRAVLGILQDVARRIHDSSGDGRGRVPR